MNRRLPNGTRVELSPTTWVGEQGRALYGGSPPKMVFLKPAAIELLAPGSFVVDDRTAALARLLVDRGLADQRPQSRTWKPSDVTVVVPVKDRPAELKRLLNALPSGVAVVVVDDGSKEPVVSGPATLVRHDVSQGPSAARNRGLREVRTPLVAFVDSDVVPVAGWLERLLIELADPAVGIVAPRIGALHAETKIARYEAVRSSLDLGPVPSLVVPGGRVSYVPSACLVGRVAAFSDGFDATMHVGEDVDLVWRTIAAGWLVRYVPGALVCHDHRTEPIPWLARKAFYGTSAAQLALKHGEAVSPLVVGSWTIAATAAVFGQNRRSLAVAGGIGAVAIGRTARRLTSSTRPWAVAVRLAPYGAGAALAQCSAAMNRHYWPVAVALSAVSRRVRRAWLTAALLEGLVEWTRLRPQLDPVSYLVLRRADDLAYGVGLWLGAWRARTTTPLRPKVLGASK